MLSLIINRLLSIANIHLCGNMYDEKRRHKQDWIQMGLDK